MNSFPIDPSNLQNFYNNFSELKQKLKDCEYRSGFIQRLKDGYGIIHTPRRVLTFGNPTTEVLLSFFSDNKSFSYEIISQIIGSKLTNELLEVGMFTNNGTKNNISSAFRIIPVNQFLTLIPFRQFNNPPVYIGADSLTFARHIQYFSRPEHILDLATGSGFQLFNLPWHSGSTSMTGLDINPNAIQTGLINSNINSTPWINFEEFNIQEDLNSISKKFDLIIGNPPIIPTPDSGSIKTRLGGMIHADGGRDGFNVARSIISQISGILTPNGSLQLILCSLGTANKVSIAKELENLLIQNNLLGQLVIIKKIPVELDAYYRGQRDLQEYNRWMKFYKEEKATYWYRLILRIQRNNENYKQKLHITQLIRTDLSQPPNGERVTFETIVSKISFYLSDTLLQNEDYSKIEYYQNKIISLLNKEKSWKVNSITYFGSFLFTTFPEIFPTKGSAIRFWGQCTNEYWWKPKYLERVLW